MKEQYSNEEQSAIQESGDKETTENSVEVNSCENSAADELNPEQTTTREKGKMSIKSLVSFGVVSSVTGLLALGGFWLMVLIYDNHLADKISLSRDWAVAISEYISVIVSCLFSFALNKRFTFSDRKARTAGIWLYILYYFIVTPLGAWVIVALINAGLSPLLAKVIKMTINVITDFCYCRYFLFRYLRKKYDPTIKGGFLKE